MESVVVVPCDDECISGEDNVSHEKTKPHNGELKENLSSYENICSSNRPTFDEEKKKDVSPSKDSDNFVSLEDEECSEPVLNSESPNGSNSHILRRQRQHRPKQRSCKQTDGAKGRNYSLLLSNNIGDIKRSLGHLKESSRSLQKEGYKKLPSCDKQDVCDQKSESCQVEVDTYLSLEENLNSLDKTVKKCYQQLNRKFKREPSNYVPNASIVRFSCRPSLKTEKVIVFIRVVFLKIGEIDTMKENFMADAFIQARWREPSLDGMVDQNSDDIDWNKFWNPKIYIENSYNEPKETVWQTLSFNSRQEATVFERRRVRGCFIENLELDEFPFDTQDLTLTIATERLETELELEEDTDEISSINVQSFVDEQEWKLHSHVETWKKITTKAYQNSKAKHPSFSTSCRATRRPGFFIWNIFLVMLFICSLTFATFCVDLMKPENRLQLSFILLLTTITFKFVVSQTLPRISYLTYLDKYILISMGILCAVCVWHAVVFSFFKENLDLARTIDRWALIVSGSSYFLFHLFFFSTIYFVALKKRWKYDKKDKEHKERIKRLQRLQELVRTNFAQEGNPTDGERKPSDRRMY